MMRAHINRRFTRSADGRVVYQADWMTVREYRVDRDGVAATYAAVERPDAVVAIPLTPTGRTVLLKQYRFPTDADSWELPMGAVLKTEPAEAAARRELMEEVGMPATELVKVGEFHPAPGLSPQRATVFVARVEDEALDLAIDAWSTSEEIQEVASVTISEAATMITDGRLTDGFSLAGFLLLRLWLDQRRGANA